MMKNLLVAAAASLLFAAAVPMAPHADAATPSQQELLLKKKKAAAEKKAAEKKAAEKKAAAEKKKKQEQARRNRRDCGNFFECLFGGSPRTVARTGKGSGGADRPTAKVVSWDEGKYAPGSIVVRTPERALYLVMDDGKARRYSVGVGKEGFQWSGNSRIVSKQEWPTWRPPAAMIAREAKKGHILPEVMEGGPQNPLGARALYIGGTLYRIHGTNNAASIGGAVSSGCIRMMNSDVIDLYERVKVGARVYVYQ